MHSNWSTLNAINRHTAPQIIVMGKQIEYVKKVIDLGIINDDTLSWSPQISAICQKSLPNPSSSL